MSLRTRLILGVALVLAGSLVLGGLLVCWQAVRKVDTEMNAAINVGERTVASALQEAQGASDPWRHLTAVVGELDGDRHLRATLLDATGGERARSKPMPPADPAPAWLYNLLARREQTRTLMLPGTGTIVLNTDAHNEISEVWSSAVLMLGTLVLVCSLNALLVAFLTGRALAPLTQVVAACARIGAGDYGPAIAEPRGRELQDLILGFNQMAHRLATLADRQWRLEEQLVKVQEEERAELARDLHDEVGPLLFAVGVDLVALGEAPALRDDPVLQRRLAVARETVARMQHEVRRMLGRLRPPSVVDLGLSHSIGRLAAFWQTRYPQVAFEVAVLKESLPAEVGTHIYRIVQESISNAVRHGRPQRIAVSIRREDGGGICVQVTDDGVGLPAQGRTAGLGLTGMRERVRSCGGELEVSCGAQGHGVIVSARLPAQAGPAEIEA